MTDSIKDQIFLITPFIKDLEKIASSKKDKALKALVKNAKEGFQFPDIEPSLELLISHVEDKNPEVQSICIHAFQDLFTSKQFDFFLSANHSSMLLKSLIGIITTVKSKSSLFTEACQCLSYFLLSSNQQLYIHNAEILFLFNNLFAVHSKHSNEHARKNIEGVIKRFLHNLESLASRSSEKVDDYICLDIKSSAGSLVKCIQNENICPETAKLIISLLESIVFDAAPQFKECESYQHILLVEIPQLFIQYSLNAPDSVFPSISDFFTRFVGIGQPVLASFPTIIDQMITPAIEAQNDSALRALSLLSKFCGSHESPYLISVFAICDCSSTECKRVFETVYQAISKMAMDNVVNPPKVNSCLAFLNKSLNSFQKFFMKLQENKNSNDNSNEDENNIENKNENKAENDPQYADIVSQEREVLDKKMTVEGCAKAFNKSPKKGVLSIINSGLAENNPPSLAQFIKDCQLLEPAVVSDFLGRPENAEILNEYIKTFNFTKMSIDNALRELCSQFRLPGESQQIDRVMLSFASKYHTDNPTMSEDAAYVLSFSIIMLHTDIHNPNVVRKITCDEWIDNTRNVKEACEVEISTLREIYSRIVAKPMKDGSLSPYAEAATLKRRGKKQLQRLMSQEQKNVTITREILYLAFDRLWSTLFAAFSLCIQEIPDDTTVSLALQGQQRLVFFLSHFRMTKELESVISFICVFSTTAESDQRRIAGIESILKICKEDANELGDTAWLPILELFSTLMRNSSPLDGAKPVEQDIQLTPMESVINLPVDKIEQVYESATQLNRFSYISFLNCICRVSISEVFMNPPSLYSFQKIVDIAIANVNRVRFVWSQSWNIFNSHFCRVGCLAHNEIAMFTVRQLVRVVTAVTEDSDKWKHFQYETLMPYCTIFQNQSLYEPRRFIIAALSHLIGEVPLNKAWDALLDIFEIAATDKSSEIVQHSFEMLESAVATIPDIYSSKATVVLIKMATQNVFPDIIVSSMSFSIAFALKVQPITPILFNIVQIALNSTSKEVMALAANLYFLLVLKYDSEPWESIENMYILPLFATPKKELQVQLMQEVFRTLLPAAGEKSLSLIPQITLMFIEVNDGEVLDPLTREIVTLAGSEDSSEVLQRISTQMLEMIFNSGAVKPEMLLTLYSNIRPSVAFYDVIIFCIKQSMNLQSPQLVRKGFEILISVTEQYYSKEMNKKYDISTADIIIAVLMFINSQTNDAANDLLHFVTSEMKKCEYKYIRCKKIEFQRTVFAFFLNESRPIRELAKELADTSQKLFIEEQNIA